MNIENIFTKKLTRDINGVVKADQLDEQVVYTELDEYVVTRELDRHLRRFFECYLPAVMNPNDPSIQGKVGVWVSGFFGSGKSHFIKILSYLLENKEAVANGSAKKAVEFFRDKITDHTLFSEIYSAVNRDTDVILFNIDSRANTDDREDAILKVFLKVFNEKQGYCANYPHVAHMERELEQRSQYQVFQDKFAELTRSTWANERDAYDFYRDDMAAALAHATQQTEESTRQWVERLETNFPLDIKNFCEWVKEYLDRSGDKRLLFMVDEVGQFIGDNSQMMLKLQTITENLGTICGGRAWVIVTSQADIDAVLGDLSAKKGQDFSKIQGRFSTRISLSSSNTNEVIQKRLLDKTDGAAKELAEVYAANSDTLKHQLMFDETTTAELGNYPDSPTFVDNYPFIPYQYTLVQKVFDAIRRAGATGTNLSRGERSLLDAFQNAAVQVKNENLGALIPFYRFYPAIESFLDTAVKMTIDQACEKKTLTPFDGEILKTLFLIRYVDVLKSTLDNLVTLSIDQIDCDKVSLKRLIEESLIRLEREVLIARSGDEYVFLTNEEKEIENEIKHVDIEPAEETRELAKVIFDGLLRGDNQYRYPVNKQDFAVTRFCNGHPIDGSKTSDLVLKVVSPLDSMFEEYRAEAFCMSQSLANNGCVLLVLEDDKRLWDEFRNHLKTARFLKQNLGQRPEQERLLNEKALENNQRGKDLRENLCKLVSQAPIYAIGSKLNPKGSSFKGMLEDAYGYVIENTFSKLSQLPPTANVLEELKSIIVADDIGQLGLDIGAPEHHPQAMQELERFIIVSDDNDKAIYLRDLLERFKQRPYGWANNDILLLVAKQALAGKLSLFAQGEELPLRKSFDHLTSVRRQADLRLRRVQQHSDRQLKKAGDLARDLFGKTVTGNDKELFSTIQHNFTALQQALQGFELKASSLQCPGKNDIAEGLRLCASVLEQTNAYSFIERMLDLDDDLSDFIETFEDLEEFFGKQFGIWQKLADALSNQFANNRDQLEKDAEAKAALAQLDKIYTSQNPYNQLSKVEGLISQVQKANLALLDAERDKATLTVNSLIAAVTPQLEALPSDLKNKALYPLQQCLKRISDATSVHQIISEASRADEFEDDAIQVLNQFAQQQSANTAPQTDQAKPTVSGGAVKGSSSSSGTITLGGQDLNSPTTVTTPAVKQIVTVSPQELLAESTEAAYIETEQDIERYLDALRSRLTAEVSKGAKVRIK